MKTHRKLITALLGVSALGTLAAAAFATAPSGLTSQLLARGAAGEISLHDKSEKLKLQAKDPTDVAVVKATLAQGGYTGWHSHPGPSIVVVKPCATSDPCGVLTMDELADGACVSRTFGPGSAFLHPEDAHNFRNTGTGTLEFYVVYLVPAGAAPLLTDVSPAPAACS
jgi:hypothetical protein